MSFERLRNGFWGKERRRSSGQPKDIVAQTGKFLNSAQFRRDLGEWLDRQPRAKLVFNVLQYIRPDGFRDRRRWSVREIANSLVCYLRDDNGKKFPRGDLNDSCLFTLYELERKGLVVIVESKGLGFLDQGNSDFFLKKGANVFARFYRETAVWAQIAGMSDAEVEKWVNAANLPKKFRI